MDGRDIERAAERLGSRHSPVIGKVVVLRRETIDVHRSIREQGVGENRAVIQCVTVQERLQDTSGTARRPCDIHIDPGPFPVRRRISAIRDNLARSHIHHHCRKVRNSLCRQVVAFPVNAFFHSSLKIQVNAGLHIMSTLG